MDASQDGSNPAQAAAVPSGSPDARIWLFDFDNTLAALEPEVDWAGSRRELERFLRSEGITNAIFEEFPKGNLPLYAALLVRLTNRAGGAAEAIAGYGLARSNPDALLRRASEMIEAYELRGVDRATPLPGTSELLRSLHARGSLSAVVTSNSARTVMRWLERHHMAGEIAAIVGRDSMLPLKPAPDMVFRALQLCGAPANDAVFIGDSIADLAAARAAQVGFYGVAAKPKVRDHLIASGAREVFASPAALTIYLNLPFTPDDSNNSDRPAR